MKLKPTNEQKQIIHHAIGHAMVKAGPGCAKTSTLALRVKQLLEQGCCPENIVIMTYTNALVEDIRRTLAKLLSTEDAKQVVVKTIHGFAFKLVNQHYERQGQPQSSVLRAGKKKQLIQHYAKKYKLKLSDIKQAFNLFETDNNAQLITALGKAKAKRAKSAYKAYSRYKAKYYKVDFQDMIGLALELLKSDSNPASLLGDYQHLMVDELQDVNGPQKDLILALSQHMTSTVLVGDTHQAIYGWRQALPRYWNDLAKVLMPKQFSLTLSFRTPRQALPFVHDIAVRIDKYAPVMKSAVDGKKPVLVELVDQDAQYRWLAKEIKTLQAKGIDANQIAILARTHKELSQAATALCGRRITVTERNRPNTNKHRSHLLALIKLTCLEQRRLNKRTKRLTLSEQEQAMTYIESLWLRKKVMAELQDRLSKKPTKILSVSSDNKHYKRINELSKAIKRAAELTNVQSAIQCLIDASKPILKDRRNRHHKLLVRDLVDIKIKARQCATLDNIDVTWGEASVPDEVPGVQILTVHGGKGREWDYLFLINVVKGIYPRYQPESKALEEEKRVFYVAVTRHHHQLYLLQTPVPVKRIQKNPETNSVSFKSVNFKKTSSFIDVKKQRLIHKVMEIEKRN